MLLCNQKHFIIMETANKEIVEKKTYVHDDKEKDYASKGVAGTGLGLGIAGTALGLLALNGNGRGLFGWGGGASMPENVNINTYGGASSAAAPTAFQAWEKSCDDAIALTNAMWGLKVGSMQADYDHRNTDVAELYCVGEVELRLLDSVFVDFRGIVAVNLYSEFTEGYLSTTHAVEKR